LLTQSCAKRRRLPPVAAFLWFDELLPEVVGVPLDMFWKSRLVSCKTSLPYNLPAFVIWSVFDLEFDDAIELTRPLPLLHSASSTIKWWETYLQMKYVSITEINSFRLIGTGFTRISLSHIRFICIFAWQKYPFHGIVIANLYGWLAGWGTTWCCTIIVGGCDTHQCYCRESWSWILLITLYFSDWHTTIVVNILNEVGLAVCYSVVYMVDIEVRLAQHFVKGVGSHLHVGIKYIVKIPLICTQLIQFKLVATFKACQKYCIRWLWLESQLYNVQKHTQWIAYTCTDWHAHHLL